MVVNNRKVVAKKIGNVLKYHQSVFSHEEVRLAERPRKTIDGSKLSENVIKHREHWPVLLAVSDNTRCGGEADQVGRRHHV
jgi:hypothetical protein